MVNGYRDAGGDNRNAGHQRGFYHVSGYYTSYAPF